MFPKGRKSEIGILSKREEMGKSEIGFQKGGKWEIRKQEMFQKGGKTQIRKKETAQKRGDRKNFLLPFSSFPFSPLRARLLLKLLHQASTQVASPGLYSSCFTRLLLAHMNVSMPHTAHCLLLAAYCLLPLLGTLRLTSYYFTTCCLLLSRPIRAHMWSTLQWSASQTIASKLIGCLLSAAVCLLLLTGYRPQAANCDAYLKAVLR